MTLIVIKLTQRRIAVIIIIVLRERALMLGDRGLFRACILFVYVDYGPKPN